MRRLIPPLALVALLPGPAAALGLHPEDMNNCIAAETDTILDALAATPGAGALSAEDLASAYGESFANCTREPEVGIWQQCFGRPDALDCLTGMGDVAAAQIALDKAAASYLAREAGQPERVDNWPVSEAAVAAFADGIGGAARANCEAEPPQGIAPVLNVQACRILFELGQYASWRGGGMLWSGLQDLSTRAAPPPSLSVSEACLAETAPAARAERGQGDGGAPGLDLSRGALEFVGCSNAATLLPACAEAPEGLAACVQTLWRTTRAERIAEGLVTQAALPADLSSGVAVANAIEDMLIGRCLQGTNVQRLPPNTGWAYCSVSVNGMQVAMFRGMLWLEEIAR